MADPDRWTLDDVDRTTEVRIVTLVPPERVAIPRADPLSTVRTVVASIDVQLLRESPASPWTLGVVDVAGHRAKKDDTPGIAEAVERWWPGWRRPPWWIAHLAVQVLQDANGHTDLPDPTAEETP